MSTRAGGVTTAGKRVLSTLGPAAIFLLLSASFLWLPIATGKAFLPTDLSYRYDYVWRHMTDTPGVHAEQNPLLSDVSDYYFPYASYAMSRLREGEFPLWNPYILTGTPFFASAQAAVLDPVNLLTYLAGPYDYWLWAALLRLTIIGLTTFGFARALGRSPAASIAAGVVFMLCGFVVAWLNYSVVTSLTWMPALFFTTTRLLQTGRPVWLGGVGLSIGLLLLGGHPETQFLVGLAWGFYCLYWLFTSRGQIAGRIARLAGATAVGLGLSAVQVVPFLQFLLDSPAISERATPVLPFNLGHMALRVAVLLFPNFSGTPVMKNYWVPPFTNFNEQVGYIGLLAIGLAVVGTLHWWRRDRLVPFFAIMLLLGVLLAIRGPGFHLIRALPLFNIGHGVRWVILLSFFGAVLAAYGLDALIAARAGAPRLRNAGLLAGAAAMAGAAILLVVYLGIRDGYWDLSWGAIISHEEMARLFHPTRLTVYWPVIYLAVGATVILARWKGLIRAGAMATLLIAPLYADLWTFGSRYNPATPKETVFPPTPPISYLQDNLEHERFVGTTGMLRPNVPMVFRLRDFRGLEDVVDQQFMRLYDRFDTVLDVDTATDLRFSPEHHRILQVSGVQYILTQRKPRVVTDARPYTWRMQEAQVAVYENLQAVPRAHVAFNSLLARDTDEATPTLFSPEHDPARTVILTVDGEQLSNPDPSAGSGQALNAYSVPVTWVMDEPEEVVLRVDTPAPGYLVLADSYARWWEATVNEQPTPILRANVAFRAVALPPGEHTVAFHYRPWPVYLSALVSLLALLTILALGFRHLIKGR